MAKFLKSPFQLVRYRIFNSHVEFDRENDENDEGRLIYTVDLEPKFSIEESTEEGTGNDRLKGVVTLSVRIHGRQKPKGKILRKVEVEIEGVFTGEGLQKDQFESLLKINGTFSLLGIVRAYIISVTSQMGFREPVVMPFINITALKDS